MTAYLDNASTTRPRPEVLEAMAAVGYGNPSSVHAPGRQARRAIEDAREKIADGFRVRPRQVIFTSGATEANNLAIAGTAPGRLSVSPIEHESVLQTARHLARRGTTVHFMSVDSSGRVDPSSIGDGSLVSVMLVNNETGVIQPVAEIARRARAAEAQVHVDAVQALGRVEFDIESLGVDLLSISSHKIHGPKGVGALIARDPEAIRPVLFGGAQEFEKRAGTENVAGIVGFARAFELAREERPVAAPRVAALRDRLESGLLERVRGSAVNGDRAGRAPHISNLRFEGVDAEALMMALDGRGVWISAGSACAALGTEPSHVLAAMGLDPAAVRGSVRFSLSSDTTERDIEEALEAVPAAVAALRGD
jgi:cysteine desulfurase